MNELQTKLMGIINWVHTICIDNNIKYSLIGGSLIGAIREKGFIPWDDDIDIAMDYDNYNKFASICGSYSHDKYEILMPLKTKQYIYAFIKVVDKTTTIVEEKLANNIKLTKGIFIDIFPMIEVQSEEVAIPLIARRLRNFDITCIMQRKTITLKRKLIKMVSPIINYKFVVRRMLNDNKQPQGHSYLYDVDGYFSGKNVVPKEWFNDFIMTKFEGVELMIIAEYDKYLTKIFGNYMLPPEAKNRATHESFYLNLNMPYREYIAKKGNV